MGIRFISVSVRQFPVPITFYYHFHFHLPTPNHENKIFNWFEISNNDSRYWFNTITSVPTVDFKHDFARQENQCIVNNKTLKQYLKYFGLFFVFTQSAFTCSKPTMETPAQTVKSVQSNKDTKTTSGYRNQSFDFQSNQMNGFYMSHIVLMSLLITQNRSHTLFRCFYS